MKKLFLYMVALTIVGVAGPVVAQERMAAPAAVVLTMPKTLSLSNDGQYMFQRYQVVSLTKEELYARTSKWLKEKVNTGGVSPELDEGNHMGFKATAVISLPGLPDSEVRMAFQVSLKEGKYRLDAYTFVFRSKYKGVAYENEFSSLEDAKLSMPREKVYAIFDQQFTAWLAEFDKALK